jgi:hypothetical protein
MIGYTRDVLRVLRMPCREHTVLLSRQMDGPLTRGEAAGLRIHVMYCTGCARFRAQIRLLRSAAEKMGMEMDRGEGIPAGVRERVMHRAADAAKKSE